MLPWSSDISASNINIIHMITFNNVYSKLLSFTAEDKAQACHHNIHTVLNVHQTATPSNNNFSSYDQGKL